MDSAKSQPPLELCKNAGDGVGEHPTQALLDLYTMRCELLNGMKIFNTSDALGSEVSHVTLSEF